jgi:hypothetical protein
MTRPPKIETREGRLDGLPGERGSQHARDITRYERSLVRVFGHNEKDAGCMNFLGKHVGLSLHMTRQPLLSVSVVVNIIYRLRCFRSLNLCTRKTIAQPLVCLTIITGTKDAYTSAVSPPTPPNCPTSRVPSFLILKFSHRPKHIPNAHPYREEP